MRALGENRIPGVPWNLRMLLLGQTQLVSSGEAGITRYDVGSVLDRVIRSDKRREDGLRELNRQFQFPITLPIYYKTYAFWNLKVLTNALENANEPMAIVRTRRIIHHGRLESKLAEMKEIASRRSGARGARARGDLLAMEEQVEHSAALWVVQQEMS